MAVCSLATEAGAQMPMRPVLSLIHISPDFFTCLTSVLHPPYGVYGVLICIGLLAILLLMVMRMGYSDTGEYDTDRNFVYSAKGKMCIRDRP